MKCREDIGITKVVDKKFTVCIRQKIHFFLPNSRYVSNNQRFSLYNFASQTPRYGHPKGGRKSAEDFHKNDKDNNDSEFNKKELLLQTFRMTFNLELIYLY